MSKLNNYWGVYFIYFIRIPVNIIAFVYLYTISWVIGYTILLYSSLDTKTRLGLLPSYPLMMPLSSILSISLAALLYPIRSLL